MKHTILIILATIIAAFAQEVKFLPVPTLDPSWTPEEQAAVTERAARMEHAVIYGTLLELKRSPEFLRELPNTTKTYLVIRFDKPIEVESSNWEAEDSGKNGKVRITQVHLFYEAKDSDIDALIGKKVIAIGEISERDTAYQMAPILFSVNEGNLKGGAFMRLKK